MKLQFLKVNKSAYIAKSRQRHHKTTFCCTCQTRLKIFVHLNYGTFLKNSSYYSSIHVDFINSVIAIHVFVTSNSIFLHQPRTLTNAQSESCLAVTYSIHFQPLITSVTWSINFQMVFLFYISFSSVYLFSIQQLRALIAEM